MRPAIMTLILVALATAGAMGQQPERLVCGSPEALAQRVVRCIRERDTTAIGRLAPTVNDLMAMQEELRTPGAFRIDQWEAEAIVWLIDSAATASLRQIWRRMPEDELRTLRVGRVVLEERPGDMPYYDIDVQLRSRSGGCWLHIDVAMGFPRSWTLGHEAFELTCVQDAEVLEKKFR